MPRFIRESLLRVLVCALASLFLTAGAAQPAAAATPLREGVAVDIVFGEPASAELADVDEAAALGASTLRVSLQWSGFEISKGQYAGWYRDRLDALVARARSRNLKVLLTPVFTPCWAARATAGVTNPCAPASQPIVARVPPARTADYGDFVGYLARRYNTSLAGIEVWNEPNLEGFWKTPDPVGDYVALVRAARSAIKRVSTVPVIAGALAGSDAAFLDRLLARGMKGNYDAISVHPYNDGRAPTALIDPQYASATFLQGLRNVKATLAKYSETRPVWLTEFGWNTSTQRGELWLDGVTEQEQAEFLAQALAMLRDPGWGINYPAAAFVYRLRDIGLNDADPQYNYGLVNYDRTRKRAFAAVRMAFAAQ